MVYRKKKQEQLSAQEGRLLNRGIRSMIGLNSINKGLAVLALPLSLTEWGVAVY